MIIAMNKVITEGAGTFDPSMLPEGAQSFLAKQGIRAIGCERLAGESKAVFKVLTEDATLVLKHNPKASGLSTRLRRALIGSLGFDRERRFYENASKARCANHIADYIASDPNNLLIELLPTKSGREWAPEGEEWDVLARGLLLLHWESGMNDSGFRAFVHRSIYGPVGVALRVGFPCVRAELGCWMALRYIVKILSCIWKQPKLPRRHLCHNDFLPNNILFSENSSEVFFIDFQDVTSSRKWPLFDLIGMTWHIEGCQLNGPENGFFEAYIEGLAPEVREHLNLKVQVQFGLLVCLVHGLHWLKLNGRDRSEPRDFLLQLIIGDAANPFHLKIKDQLAGPSVNEIKFK